MGAPAGSWTSGLTSPDGPDSYQWNHTQNTYFLRACGRCRAQHRQLYRNVHACEWRWGAELTPSDLPDAMQHELNWAVFNFSKTPYQRPQQTLPIPPDIENKRTPGSGDTKRFQILAVVHWGLHTGSCFVWPPRINTTQQRKGGRHLSNTHAGVMCLS